VRRNGAISLMTPGLTSSNPALLPFLKVSVISKISLPDTGEKNADLP